MRGVSRLLKAVRKIYGEEFGITSATISSFGGMNLTDLPGVESSGKGKDEKEKPEEPAILKYIKNKVQGGFHSIFSLLIKSASVLTEEQFVALIRPTWDLLLEPDIQVRKYL
jgi:hypothetical protein